MKIIGFDDIVKLNISPKICYDWVCEMLENKRESILPTKISMKPEAMYGVFFNCMPCLIPGSDCAGVKIVTRYPKREPCIDSQILLYRLSDGKNIALLDGTWITAMRTGAVAAYSIKKFAVPDYMSLGFIGLGNTARATLKTLLSVYDGRPLTVYLKKYKSQHQLFAKKFEVNSNLTFVFCDTVEQVIDRSEVIVSTVTFCEQDFCEDRYFREGCLLIPIHTRGFTNCDLFFDKVYADDRNHVKHFKYFDKFKYFAEVSDVIAQTKEGRTSSDERIIVYNIGISLHDVYFAHKIEKMCNDAIEMDLYAPKEKFWV